MMAHSGTVLTLVFGLVIAGSADAQDQKKRKCTGTAPDTTVQLVHPVYRDCDVDQPAKLRGGEPTPAWRPDALGLREGCLTVELEFVVDTLGNPEPLTITTKSSDNRDFEDAVRVVAKDLRYAPARLEGRAVRQLVVYKREVIIQMRVVSSSGGPPAPSRRPPRC